MKKTLLIVLFSCLGLATAQQKKDSIKKPKERYPAVLKEVFKAHGGLAAWDSIKEMKFSRGKYNAQHIVDTHRRREHIYYGDSEMGFDGTYYWKKAKSIIKANPVYTINQHFYFLAMPFVLADEGVKYSLNTPVLEYEDTYFPGIKISFEYGTGQSSRDEYVLYYNPKTYRMEFLSYTLTYYTRRKSVKVYLKRYKDWRWENGVLVPELIENYSFANNRAWGKSSDFKFSTIYLNKEITREELFRIPKDGEKVFNTM